MICEVRNNNTEVALSHVTFGDIIAFIRVWLSKDKEIVFNDPNKDGKKQDETM